MSTKKPAIPADAVFEALHEAMHLYRALQFRALRDSAATVSQMELRALGYFARNPDATLSDLVTHSGRDKAQIARLIAGLRERGLLDARPDTRDGRVTRLSLSEAGRAVHQALQQHSRTLADAATAGLSAAERAQLIELLERLRAGLTACA